MIEDLLTESFTLEDPIVTKDASGGVLKNEPWNQVVTAAPCRVQDASSDVQERFMVRDMVVTHTIFTLQGTGIASRMRLTIQPDNRLMRVQGVDKRREIGGMDTFFLLHCEELRTGVSS